MSLPCYKRIPPASEACDSDLEFAWDLPEEGIGIIRGPKAKEYLEERGIEVDLRASTQLERVRLKSPLRLYYADLELPGRLLGPYEDMPPQRRFPLMGTDKEKSAVQAEKRFRIAALAVETKADRILAEAYLEMTGKVIPLLETHKLNLSQQIAKARQVTLSFLSRDLTKTRTFQDSSQRRPQRKARRVISAYRLCLRGWSGLFGRARGKVVLICSIANIEWWTFRNQ